MQLLEMNEFNIYTTLGWDIFTNRGSNINSNYHNKISIVELRKWRRYWINWINLHTDSRQFRDRVT